MIKEKVASSSTGIYLFTAIGLLLGILLDQLVRHTNTTVFYYSLAILFSLLYTLTYNEKNLLRLAGTSLLLALFLSFPLLPLKMDFSNTDYLHLLTFLAAFPFFAYVAHSYHYAYHHDDSWHLNYTTLFAAVWNTIPLLIIACVFSSLANMLLMLGAFVFKTVGSDFLWNLYFSNIHFKLISTTTLFFIGLAVGQQNVKIIYSLRFLMLRIMYYLLPFLALISGIYLILYVGHTLSAGQEHINPLLVLLPLSILGILFFNAYYQDGKAQTQYPAWMRLALSVYRVILFILVLIMTYNIMLHYSIDINICIYLLVAILFTALYAVTAFFSETLERKWIAIGNISTGLIFISLLYLCNLPYLPVNISIGGGANHAGSSLTSSLFH